MTKHTSGKRGRQQKSLGAVDLDAAQGSQLAVLDDSAYLRPSLRGQRRAAEKIRRKLEKAERK
jgi:hypothetical protein